MHASSYFRFTLMYTLLSALYAKNFKYSLVHAETCVRVRDACVSLCRWYDT